MEIIWNSNFTLILLSLNFHSFICFLYCFLPVIADLSSCSQNYMAWRLKFLSPGTSQNKLAYPRLRTQLSSWLIPTHTSVLNLDFTFPLWSSLSAFPPTTDPSSEFLCVHAYFLIYKWIINEERWFLSTADVYFSVSPGQVQQAC